MNTGDSSIKFVSKFLATKSCCFTVTTNDDDDDPLMDISKYDDANFFTGGQRATTTR